MEHESSNLNSLCNPAAESELMGVISHYCCVLPILSTI